MPQADRTRQSASTRFVMEGAMHRAVVIASAFVTFGFLAGESWAGSISLQDRYIRVHILRACFEANGQSTGGTGPGGYGCKTSKGQVSCTAEGKCTGTCQACGRRRLGKSPKRTLAAVLGPRRAIRAKR